MNTKSVPILILRKKLEIAHNILGFLIALKTPTYIGNQFLENYIFFSSTITLTKNLN